MEKIFKKSLALVLSAALCLTALVGCLTVSAADETTPAYAISTDAKGKAGDTVEVIAEYTNISTVCGHYVTVTFPANFTVKEVYQAKESADGETYKLLTAYKEGSEENWQYKMDVVEGKTAIKSCDIINFFASEGSEHNVTTGSLKFKFVVTIGEVEVGEYPVTIAVEAASQDEMWITPVITNGKITVEANEPSDTEIEVTFRHNLNLADKLDILFAVPVTSFTDCEKVYLVAEKELYDLSGNVTGTETITIDEYSTTVLSNYYAFYYGGTLAKEMGSKVRVTVYGEKADGTKIHTQIDEYSVIDYVRNRLSKTTNAKEKTVLVDILDYGTAAQKYFTYNTSNLVIDMIDSSYLVNRGTLDKTVVVDGFTTTPNEGATVTLRKNLSLASSIEIIVGFTSSASDLKMKFEYTNIKGNQEVLWVGSDEFQMSSGMTYASFTEFTALEMNKVVTATLYSGDTPISDTITYSVYSYAIGGNPSRLDRTDDFGVLIQQMIKYGQSATAFKS